MQCMKILSLTLLVRTSAFLDCAGWLESFYSTQMLLITRQQNTVSIRQLATRISCKHAHNRTCTHAIVGRTHLARITKLMLPARERPSKKVAIRFTSSISHQRNFAVIGSSSRASLARQSDLEPSACCLTKFFFCRNPLIVASQAGPLARGAEFVLLITLLRGTSTSTGIPCIPEGTVHHQYRQKGFGTVLETNLNLHPIDL